jgi:hypothetical protein
MSNSDKQNKLGVACEWKLHIINKLVVYLKDLMFLHMYVHRIVTYISDVNIGST